MLTPGAGEALSEERHDQARKHRPSRALCCLKAGDARTCARLAGCACHLDPAYKLAQYWLDEGLKALPQGSSTPPKAALLA